MRHLLSLVLVLSTVSAAAAEVRVFAAVSLTEALEEIAVAYEKKTGDDVVFHFGASSMLARQIEQGAPADLFLSADEAKMDALARQGLIVAATRASVLSNTLVIVVPKDGGMTIASPAQLANVRSLALAEPSSVPAGVYARTWLQKIGLWERLAPKVIPTDNVRAALAAVESGNVDAAIVYKTDARIAKHTRVAYEVPRAQGPKISYPFALLRDAENRQAATRFLAYLKSKAALNIFAKHGFIAGGSGQSAEGRSSKDSVPDVRDHSPSSIAAEWRSRHRRGDDKPCDSATRATPHPPSAPSPLCGGEKLSMFRSRESFSHRVPSPLGSLIAEGRGGSEATGEGRLSRGASLERFAHFEILSLTHTHPPCAQNDGATSALCALRSAL